MTRYHFVKEDMIGYTDEPIENYDLMEVVIIRRGNKTPDCDIFKYLNAVFASDKENIQKYIDMDRNPQIREEVDKMSGMGQTIYDRGIEKGIEKGIEQGIEKGIEQGVMQGIIKMGYDLSLPDSEIIKQLQAQLGASLQKAQEYLEKFGKQTV